VQDVSPTDVSSERRRFWCILLKWTRNFHWGNSKSLFRKWYEKWNVPRGTDGLTLGFFYPTNTAREKQYYELYYKVQYSKVEEEILRFISFIHLAVCLTTGPKPLPKRALHIVRSRASSFKWGYPLLSLRSSNSFLHLLPCLPVTSIPPCIFPSITRCRRQFLRKMWPIQFAFRLRISCRIFLCSLTLSNTSSFCHMISPTDLFHPSPASHFKIFQVFLIYCFFLCGGEIWNLRKKKIKRVIEMKIFRRTAG
jgi:hypothetical protein